MAALLSPLQLYAGVSLLQNQGIEVSPGVTAAISAYTTTPLLAPLIATMNASGVLLPATQTALQTFASSVVTSCPALADSVVAGTSAVSSPTLANPGMTGIVTLTASAYLGSGDIGKFSQIFNSAVNFARTTNIFIDSAVNAETYLGGTFTSMNSLITSGLTDVNMATQAMGDDLSNAGYWINLNNLANFGTPLALVQQVAQRGGGIGATLLEALVNNGIDELIVRRLKDNNVSVTDATQQIMYYVLNTISGTALEEILQVLKIWTPNINTLADLLNPAVMLPNSYSSLTTPTQDGLRGIYITAVPATPYPSLAEESSARVVGQPLACTIRLSDNPTAFTNTATGSGNLYTVNAALETLLPPYGFDLDQLGIITSPGLALANKAFANALMQITNICNLTLPALSAAFLAVETNKDLPIIESQSQVIPQSVIDYYTNSLATGSGENGTILLTDIIGTATGTNMTNNISNCVTIINSLYGAGVLDDLITIYDSMLAALPNDLEIGNLIANAQAEINNIIISNSAETTALNTAFSGISTQLTKEVAYQSLATLDIPTLSSNSRLSIQGLIFALPSFGRDTSVGGTAQYIENIANVSTGSGQAIIASLREGRSQFGLSAAGINISAIVSSDPATVPPTAVLIPSITSESEARANVVY
jgi:hypothetical protein